jgi:hypothetical protein
MESNQHLVKTEVKVEPESESPLQWWASFYDVKTALQIGRYQFCLKQ